MGVASVDDPPVYERDGTVWYRASSLGGCVRMLALARQGYDAVEVGGSMAEVFKAGHDAEREVWAKAIIKGVAQEYVELRVSDSIAIAGHLDCWDPEGPVIGERRWSTGRIYEVKSQSESEWRPIKEGQLWQRYKFQLGVYMWATGLPLTVVRVRRGKEGGIEGEAREDFAEPPVTLAEIRQRVFQVEMLARRDLSEVACEKVEFPCPFFYTHQTSDGVLVRETVDDPGAVVLAKQYKNAKTIADIANSRVKASREALLEYVGDRTKLKLSDGTLLTRYKVGGRHVEYDRDEYWALKVTAKKETVPGGRDGRHGRDGEGGEASGDSL